MLSKEEQIRKIILTSNQPILISPQLSSGEILNNAISDLDISESDVVTYEASEGIEELRSKFKNVFIRPHSSQYKLFAIFSVDHLTTEQANTILKMLEEPPIYSRILLFANNISLVIATIKSRSKIIILPVKSQINDREGALLSMVDLPFNKYLKEINLIDDLELIALVKGGLEDWRRKGLNELNTKLFKIFAQTLNNISNTNVNRKLVLEKLYWEIREIKK